MKQMHKKNLGILIAMMSSLLLLGCENEPLENFVERKVVLASGIDFDAKKLVLLNAETGKEFQRCDPASEIFSESPIFYGKKIKIYDNKIQKCDLQFALKGSEQSNADLIKVLELSKKPIEGVIKKQNGEIIPATYFVVVTATNLGSHCNSVTGPGTSGQKCGKKK